MSRLYEDSNERELTGRRLMLIENYAWQDTGPLTSRRDLFMRANCSEAWLENDTFGDTVWAYICPFAEEIHDIRVIRVHATQGGAEEGRDEAAMDI